MTKRKYIVVSETSPSLPSVDVIGVWDNDDAGARNSAKCYRAYRHRAEGTDTVVRLYRTDDWPEGCERREP